MRLLGSRLLWFPLWLPLAAQPGTYSACGPDAPTWTRILEAVTFFPANPETASVVACNQPPESDAHRLVILTGDSPLARQLGWIQTAQTISARNVIDARHPDLKIIWRNAETIAVTQLPADANVFAHERWSGAPLIAGLRRGSQSYLWLAVSPGEQGFEKFPYLLQALGDLGLELPFRSRRLWVFFDWSYRSRVDLDYFAARWRKAGIAALQIASWHFMEPDPDRDAYLRRLIEACHRNSILVYAWIELPHVSEQFWVAHPEWREKTALLQDAHLDWRKLMNLSNPDCARAAAASLDEMLDRFDWDGANLAELYFESPAGYTNAARFTPMSPEVRAEFKRRYRFDPLEVFQPASPRHHAKTAKPMRQFLDFRADLAYRLQTEWIEKLRTYRARKPHLDLVLTHVDDRLDTTMRDTIGADAARTLAYTEKQGLRFLVEDPATVWDRGPERYTDLSRRYAAISRRPELLAIDINIVERYQDVYPTRQQTGVELLQLVNLAARAFPQVALYFESSLSTFDLPLLPSAAAVIRRDGDAWHAGWGTGIHWKGPASVNGVLWPFQDQETLWLPTGKAAVEAAGQEPPFRVTDVSASIVSASWQGERLIWEYESTARVFVKLDRPLLLTVDGTLLPQSGRLAELPGGRHRVTMEALPGALSESGGND